MEGLGGWSMLAGVALFLLGMNFMETSLEFLAGRKFKLFLKKQTSRRVKAAGSGVVITSLLQSSSIVNLLLLSMVGAGILAMPNALSVMVGANLGSTLNSWLLAALGFKYDISSIAIPLAGATGVLRIFLHQEKSAYHWVQLLFGFSLLFFGLGFIKEGMDSVFRDIDLEEYSGYPVIVYFFAGFIITVLVQSSSATMALALSALFSGAINLYMGLAIVLGAEIGTTIKLFFASIRGTVEKKQVAWGNFLFSLVLSLLFLPFLPLIEPPLQNFLGKRDPLLALVFFQSAVSLAGIIIFLPFLGLFAKFLQARFHEEEAETRYISKVDPINPGFALEALEKESHFFLVHVLAFCLKAVDAEDELDKENLQEGFNRKTVLEQYEFIKKMHGEIHAFYIRLQGSSRKPRDLERQEQLISSVRNTMYAAKNVKAAIDDINQVRKSSKDVKYEFYLESKQLIRDYCLEIYSWAKNKTDKRSATLEELYNRTRADYEKRLKGLYIETRSKHLDDSEITTLINFNRETFTAFKSFLFALKDLLVGPDQPDPFENLPGFIR